MAKFLINRRKAKGQAPGSLVFLGEQKMEKTRKRIIQYNEDFIKEIEVDTIEETFNQTSDDYCTWINIDGIHKISHFEKLGQNFNISPLALEDILNTDQRPKFFEDKKNITIIVKAIFESKTDHSIVTEQISFVIGKNYLLSFQEREGDHFEPVRERLRKSIGRIRSTGVDYLLQALFDALIDNYILSVELLGDVIEKQEKLLSQPNDTFTESIYHLKTNIAYIRKNVRPLKEIMVRLLKTDSELIGAKTNIYFQELDELVTQTLESIDFYYTMISDQLNIYNTNVSNRVNDVMKVLTIFAAIFIPLTFIAGIYGTNFDHLPELHFKYSYYVMLGIMAIVAIFMLLYFKRKKWF